MYGILNIQAVTSYTRALATDHVILNHGQVTWTTPELAPPSTTTPHQREYVSALDRFNVHRCPTRRVFSGTGLELVTRQATIRYLYHSATAATHGPALSSLDTLGYHEADGPTNHEYPNLNHVQRDTMASAVLADCTRAQQGKNRGSGPAMEESENDVGSLEQLLLYANEHYLAGKGPLGDHLGKVLYGVEKYHQRNVGPFRFHASQLKSTGYHRLFPQTFTPAVRAV
ncbi:uncharacterized protein TNCV_2726421 [Trichonephila clavipes]|nr:uncharacterized protein TNCV_2726421 [Trichonephila clavipes]